MDAGDFFAQIRKANKASLRARERYRYFTGEFTATAGRKASISAGPTERNRPDDPHRRVARVGSYLWPYSAPSPRPDRNDRSDAGRFGNAAAALTFI